MSKDSKEQEAGGQQGKSGVAKRIKLVLWTASCWAGAGPQQGTTSPGQAHVSTRSSGT